MFLWRIEGTGISLKTLKNRIEHQDELYRDFLKVSTLQKVEIFLTWCTFVLHVVHVGSSSSEGLRLSPPRLLAQLAHVLPSVERCRAADDSLGAQALILALPSRKDIPDFQARPRELIPRDSVESPGFRARLLGQADLLEVSQVRGGG